MVTACVVGEVLLVIGGLVMGMQMVTDGLVVGVLVVIWLGGVPFK